MDHVSFTTPPSKRKDASATVSLSPGTRRNIVDEMLKTSPSASSSHTPSLLLSQTASKLIERTEMDKTDWSARRDVDMLKHTLREREDEIERLTSELDTVKQEVKMKTMTELHRANRLQELELANAEMMQEKTTLNDRLAAQEREKQILLQRLEQAKQDKNMLLDEVESTTASYADAFAKLKADFERELQAAQVRQRSLEADLTELRERMIAQHKLHVEQQKQHRANKLYGNMTMELPPPRTRRFSFDEPPLMTFTPPPPPPRYYPTRDISTPFFRSPVFTSGYSDADEVARRIAKASAMLNW